MKETDVLPALAFLQPSHKDLQTVLSKVKAIETLNDTLKPLLDPVLQTCCRVANLTNGVLVILTTNSSAATQLRLQTGDIVKNLRKNAALKHIREIQVKVWPFKPVDVERGPVTKKTGKAVQLSPETAQTLLAMAETIEDENLREIMRKISRHMEEQR